MIPFFSEAGLRRMDEIVKPGVLCAFDFDGTLTPIVTRPEDAYTPPDVLQRLSILSQHTLVAIVSGRNREDLQKRLGFQPNYLIGNHGLEGLPDWERRNAEYEAGCLSWHKTLVSALADTERFSPAIWVENKRYSLTVHYRMDADPAETELALVELFSQLDPPPRVISGIWSFNLLPQDARGKGMALEQLMEISGAENAIYVGDDITDEDVFKLHRPDILSVKIGQNVESAADFFIPQVSQMVLFLDEINKRLHAQSKDKRGLLFSMLNESALL